MAGTAEKMMRRCGGDFAYGTTAAAREGFERRRGMLRSFCIFVLLAPAAGAAEIADVVLVESPRSFTLYNHFEQPISSSEKAGFLPFSPLQIIQQDVRLGDQITRAMQCLYRQKTFYLLKDETGSIIGDQSHLQLLKGCALIGDTVEIIQGGAVTLYEKSLRSPSSRLALPKGTRLIVLFRYRNAYYSLQIAPVERFGWVPAASREVWKRVRQAVSIDTSITENLHNRLNERIESANRMYKTFFDRFNAGTGQQKSIPRWSETTSRAEASWVLSEPYGHTGELDESTASLVEELRDILIGKPYTLRSEKGRITLIPKATPAP
jgi:hypothetical protein